MAWVKNAKQLISFHSL